MPEGDTIYRAAHRLRQALVGRVAETVDGPRVKRESRRLTGRTIESVESRGKHIVIAFDNGLALRTHMKMTGSWHLYNRGERWRQSPGKARAWITTADHEAVCFAAPDVQVALGDRIEEQLAALGPDLAADEFDRAEAVRRLHAAQGATISELLLDQRVMAGIGNVFKSEILHIRRIHPETPPEALGPDQHADLVDEARRQLMANRSEATRSTTGSRRRNANYHVYGRNRLPCRRCGYPVSSTEVGDRVTYWCERCQPRQPDRGDGDRRNLPG